MARYVFTFPNSNTWHIWLYLRDELRDEVDELVAALADEEIEEEPGHIDALVRPERRHYGLLVEESTLKRAEILADRLRSLIEHNCDLDIDIEYPYASMEGVLGMFLAQQLHDVGWHCLAIALLEKVPAHTDV